MTTPRQPLLHDAEIALAAPVQYWSAADGSIGRSPIQGVYLADTRLLDRLSIVIDGEPLEHIATSRVGSDRLCFDLLCRRFDRDADPDLRVRFTVETERDGVRFEITLSGRVSGEQRPRLELRARADSSAMGWIKQGLDDPEPAPDAALADDSAVWSRAGIAARLSVRNGSLAVSGREIIAGWDAEPVGRGRFTALARLDLSDAEAVVDAPSDPAPWTSPRLEDLDPALRSWCGRALGDLDALRLVVPGSPDQFLAAGAPWFFTLFGRDSLWAARLLLPLGTGLAGGTLRILARLQGSRTEVATEEQPGKIPHELRRGALPLAGSTHPLPPLYYGTIDATPLWICLLHEAWRAGLPDQEVRELLPALEAALGWLRDHGDRDGDGLIEYINESGSGLSNQGWKDSGDSVRWRSGELAAGPLALCEVQAYAYEAALAGAELLEAFGDDGAGVEWRSWAARLRRVFRERFWIDGPEGRYPAIALDGSGRAVDSLTSNIGHLLGTGLLDPDESAIIAGLLVSPGLDSGYGLRTLSAASGGYWPLSYHCGSVWAHDTAVAIRGLGREGFHEEAGRLARGLVRAARDFDDRMPELHAGDAVDESAHAVPYPAACRPQAWSAAAAITVLAEITDALG